jgi:hypothetical protein
MSRLLHVWAVSTLLVGSLAAQNSASNRHVTSGRTTNDAATVQHVSVRGTGDAVEVEIQTAGATASPDTQAIVGPDRIVVDFPGMSPSPELRALKVNRGALKGVRSGLFFSNPPITRVVLDLSEPQSYRISTVANGIIVKLGPTATATAQSSGPTVGGVHLQQAALASPANIVPARVSTASFSAAPAQSPVTQPPVTQASGSQEPVTQDSVSSGDPQKLDAAPPATNLQPTKPAMNVTYENGMLSIRVEKATLAEVLFEVHVRTGAEIAVPAGAEQEQVAANLGPAPAREVLAALLNGSAYNFIFVGDELSLERVILTRRDGGNF